MIEHDISFPPIDHNTDPYTDCTDEFLDPPVVNTLLQYLSVCKSDNTFKGENGHSVMTLGARYKYNGAANRMTDPPPLPIPPQITCIIDKIYKKFDGDYGLNSVLINHYAGDDESFLPEHSDNEPTINPE